MDNSKTFSVTFTFFREGGITTEDCLNFPATKEEMQRLQARAVSYGAAECYINPVIVNNDTESTIDFLPDKLAFNEANVNELNYLVAKLSELDGDDFDKFLAVIESGRYRGSAGVGNGELTDYINIADNLDCFTFHPNMDETGYGEHLLTGFDNSVSSLIRQLQNSSSESDQELATIVESLRECADAEQFGRSMAYNNDGEFLDSGYLIEDSSFNAGYYGVLDIPAEYRIWEPPDTFIKIVDVDLRELLMEMHALGGNYTQDAAANLQTLMQGDCFIVVNAEKLTSFPAADVFHMDSPHCTGFVDVCSGHARVYFAAINENDGDAGFRGTIHELVTDTLLSNVHVLEFDAVNIDAFKDGTNRVFTPTEWSRLSDVERGQVSGMVNRYDPYCEGRVTDFILGLRENAETNGREITQEDFLAVLNTPFMAKAQNAQQDMLRVARETARDMVARSDAEVYRLLPEGALKLSPMDVVKSNGLWFKEHREFAIKLGGLAGLQKWANRTADEIARQSLLKALNKSHNNEL